MVALLEFLTRLENLFRTSGPYIVVQYVRDCVLNIRSYAACKYGEINGEMDMAFHWGVFFLACSVHLENYKYAVFVR